jgi:hypothetical protein
MPEVSRFFVADFLLRQLPDLFTLSCSCESNIRATFGASLL